MKLCLPKNLKVGDRVQARDKQGFWYDAKVISRRGRGANLKVMVKYTGYADRHNTEFAAKDEGLREPVPPAELKAEICYKLYGGRVEGLKDDGGAVKVPGIFAAVPYCVDLIGGPYMETMDSVCKGFRPKAAQRPPRTGA